MPLNANQIQMLNEMGIPVWQLRRHQSARAQAEQEQVGESTSDQIKAKIKARETAGELASDQLGAGPGAGVEADIGPIGESAGIDRSAQAAALKASLRDALGVPDQTDTQPSKSAEPIASGTSARVGSEPAGDSTDSSAADVTDEQARAPIVKPIHFAWTRSGNVLIVHRTGLDKLHQQFLRDVVRAAQWQLLKNTAASPQAEGQLGKGSTTTGEFRWPQLVESAGTPDRALKAWANKQLSEDMLIGFDAEVITQHEDWSVVESAAGTVVQLGDLFAATTQAQAKIQLWQLLQI